MTPTVSDRAVPRDLIVIGASAGGVETLSRLVADLPADLPAALCVVVHLAPAGPSALAHILGRAGPLPCHAACDGDRLRAGEIVVAVPDRHLVVENGCVGLTRGPPENGHRPSIDVLFRSAAHAPDGRVIGVILSGMRADGAAGLAVIQAAGGVAVVQDPEQAMFPGMPRSALAHVRVDAVAPVEKLAATIVAIIHDGTLPVGIAPGDLPERPAASAEDGVMEEAEAALRAAVGALEDRRLLLERLTRQFQLAEQPYATRSFLRRAEQAARQVDAVKAALSRRTASSPRGAEEAERRMLDAPSGEKA